jgi:predicted amidohydrolase
MTRTITIALTETVNAYTAMPAHASALSTLESKLEDIRRANVEHNLALAEQARAKGAVMVGLGELCTAPYFACTRDPVWLAMAEDVERGASAREFAAAAQRLGITLVAPMYERDPASGKRFNTAVVFGPTGSILGKYRKTHIPEGKNEQGEFNEPFYFGKAADVSDYFPVFTTPHGKIGVAICYDRHFEGVVRSLAANGAELVFSPAVTFGAKSERMWEMEFEVDAARHNVFIAGSNRKGAEAPWNQPYFGRSYVVGPNGRPEHDRSIEGLVLATIDLDALGGQDPSGWNLVRDRRPDVYVR